jgi:membrane protease YdiL (CAAX protease family)
MVFLFLLMGLLAVAGCVFYGRLWVALPAGRVPGPFGRADLFLAAGLACWFLWLAFQSFGRETVVTPSAILGGGIVYGGILGMIVAALVVRGISLDAVFGLCWRGLRWGPGFVVLAFFAALPVVAAAQWVGGHLDSGGGGVQPLVEYWLGDPGRSSRVLVVGMAVVVAPLAEEFVFRGYLYRVAARWTGRRRAMVFTSALFALIHAHAPALGGLFVLAMALNLVYEQTGSIWAPVLMHSAFNGTTLAAALLWPELA